MAAYLMSLWWDEDYVVTNLPEVKQALQDGNVQFDMNTDLFYYIDDETNKEIIQNMLSSIKKVSKEYSEDIFNVVDFYFENDWIIEDGNYINEGQNLLIPVNNIEEVKTYLESLIKEKWGNELDFTKEDFGKWLSKIIRKDISRNLWKHLNLYRIY